MKNSTQYLRDYKKKKKTASKIFLKNQRRSDQPGSEILDLQQRLGNQTVTRLIQAKLIVSQPNDPDELQADKVAEEIMKIPDSEASKVSSDFVDKNSFLPPQTKSKAHVSKIPEEIMSSNLSNGQPLSRAIRDFFEPRLGYDFSDVSIYRGVKAKEASEALGAKAFTLGPNIVFDDSYYSPDSLSGRKLLGHELVHVIQQGSARMNSTSQISNILPIKTHNLRINRVKTGKGSKGNEPSQFLPLAPFTSKEMEALKKILKSCLDATGRKEIKVFPSAARNYLEVEKKKLEAIIDGLYFKPANWQNRMPKRLKKIRDNFDQLIIAIKKYEEKKQKNKKTSFEAIQELLDTTHEYVKKTLDYTEVCLIELKEHEQKHKQ